jgi:ubiquinone/menaquinone biosynthesis C-methylase UbiE
MRGLRQGVAGGPPSASAADSGSWEKVADWYDALSGDRGTDFHEHVVVPGVMRLLGLRAGELACDLACGQGVVSAAMHTAGARVTGVDLSPRLIELARARSPRGIRYIVGDARSVPQLGPGSFDAVVCVLAAMNMEPVGGLFSEMARLLRKGGRAVLVVLHPAFRAPRQSRWKWDEGRKLLIREVDRYLGPLKVPIDLHPFNRPGEAATFTYHRPVQAYVGGLVANGLLVDGLEEWPSHRVSQPGPRAKAENRARDEFPMFLAVRAVKA